MKKLLLFLTALLPMVASAYDAKIDGICYNFNGDEAEVTYKEQTGYEYLSDYTGSVIIPETVTYDGKTYTVTSIGNSAFEGCSSLTSITIPGSVTSIGDYAFGACSSLTSITIPGSVTSIGNDAFYGCSSLTSVNIGNSVTSIGNEAFRACTSLTSITIPNSVTAIGNYAFGACTSLTSVTIGNSVTSIGNNAFSYCRSLTSVTIGNSVTSIGNWAFGDCRSLTSVTIPNSVTSIGNDAFYGCSSLTSVNIPNSVTSIGNDAFSFCSLTLVKLDNNYIVSAERESYTSIKSIFGKLVKEYVIGNSVESIGNYAFSGCSGLTSITIPNSVNSIGSSAFSGCSKLASFTIPESVTSIGEDAFDDCYFSSSSFVNNSSLTSDNNWGAFICDEETTDGLLIKDSTVVKCREWATSVTIPGSVTSIGDSAFEDCTSLTSVTIGNSVTSIGTSAFRNCNLLTSVTIPGSVTSIGSSAFSGCSSLTSVTLNSNALVSASRSSSSSMQSIFGEQVKEYVIGDDVTSIGEYAFSGCSSLTSITIPGSVTSIGSSAFYSCSSLTSIKVETGNTKYDSRNNCNAIIETATNTMIAGCQNTVIPNSVTSIGEYAFSGCSSLTSVTIPDSVTSIGSSAFSYCRSLTSVTIGNSVTSIGNYAFWACTSLTSITIPNSVTAIGNYAFGACTSLTSVTIGNSVTSIGNDAFYGCRSLTSITIPEGVTSIGDKAFYYCSGLTIVISYIYDPFACSAFDNNTYDAATLYVPSGVIEAYQSTNGWKNFKNIKEIDGGTGIALNVTDENNTDITDKVNIVWYNAEGQELGTGSKLNGIADSTEVYYSVVLDEAMGRVYHEVRMQKVVAGEENITIDCQLEKIGRVQLEGRVSATDIDKTTATVNVRQMLNGKWEQTYTTQTDEQGVFKVEVYDDETDITISGDGYLDVTLHRERFGESGDVGTIPLNLISGFSVAANITMQKAVQAGETEDVTVWADGLNNIEFTLTNTSKNMAITDFTVQNGSVIIKTGADVGDEISLTAKSKQGIFADGTTTFVIVDGANAFDLQLTEQGGINATCAGSSNGVTVGNLYNSNGVLIAKGTYTGETLSLRHLQSGAYTLITMGSSTLLHNMTHLSDIASVGLSEGTDYVATNVEIIDGKLTEVAVNEVPRLDDTRFYYTSNETYFNVNKSSVTAGNYLTLQAHVDFKTEYADKADCVTLTIDLPEGCQMVENSVIFNRQAVTHTVNGSRVTIPLTKEQYESQVRFCVIPTLNQSYTIMAMASFDVDGQVTQPIGSAQFEAKGMSLSVPEHVVNTNVTINGTAKGHSEVNIYDNDVLIGKTTSKADGSWTAECELFKPYSHSFHDIYAKIVTETGMELTSETRQVEYDKNGNVPEMVTMLHGSSKIDFDLLQGTTSPTYYSYVPGSGDFTFLADFTRNDSTEIKNVNIRVLNSDGTVRTLPATFDGKQNKWVATTKYESSSRLPQNVAVEYDLLSSPEIYDEEMAEAMTVLINNMLIEVENAYKGCDVELTNEDENSVSFTATTNGYETKENFTITILDYELVKAQHADELSCHIVNDTTDMCFIVKAYDDSMSSIVVWDNLNMSACEITSDGIVLPNNMSSRRRLLPLVISAVYGVGTAIFEYNQRMETVALWRKTVESEKTHVRKLCNRLHNYLYVKCPDGSYKIKDANTLSHLQEEVNLYSTYTQKYLNDFQSVINRQQQRLQQLCIMKGGVNAALSFVGGPLVKFAGTLVKNASGWVCNSLSRILLDEVGITAMTELASQAVGIELDNLQNDKNQTIVPEDIIREWYVDKSQQIMNDYVNLAQSIKDSYSDCKKEKEEEEKEEEKDEPKNEQNDNDFKGKGTTPSIDPSGYVYEAVTSNRLEGVTVTCYQKVQVEDMYGDITEEAVVWDAEDYSQQNPLQTDETGFYRWDVPQGLWQVKYEKEGYETAYSDWLPVPPPQLDVNIGMKQSTPPTVTQMHGYESGITIDLSKYMRPETMTTDNITITRNGTTEKGTIEFLNVEKAPLGDETFVSKVKFVPEHHFNASDIVVVTVHKEVESYCGVNMTEDHIEVVRIEAEVKSIQVDEELTVAYQGERELRVLVLPKEASAGKTLLVKTSSEMIASVSATEVTIDQDGFATFTLGGELPGGAVLDFAVDGTDVTATTKVKVMYSNELVASPTASIASGTTVTIGTRITLSCETEGAIIYYTTDGSCPCDENGSRMVYDETPIIITEAVTIKAMAVVPNVGESDVAEFVYTVKGVGIEEMALDDEIQIYPLPVRDKLNVTAGGKTITSVTVSSMSGAQVASSAKPAKTVTLDVSRIPVGIYVVNVTTDNGNYSRKILKVQ